MNRLDPLQVRQRLEALPLWTHRDGAGACIEREFGFADFAQAFAFMTEVALLAERHDHHPEWSNVYNRVKVRFTTHDAEGLTERDFAMALACDGAAARRGSGTPPR